MTTRGWYKQTPKQSGRSPMSKILSRSPVLILYSRRKLSSLQHTRDSSSKNLHWTISFWSLRKTCNVSPVSAWRTCIPWPPSRVFHVTTQSFLGEKIMSGLNRCIESAENVVCLSHLVIPSFLKLTVTFCLSTSPWFPIIITLDLQTSTWLKLLLQGMQSKLSLTSAALILSDEISFPPKSVTSMKSTQSKLPSEHSNKSAWDDSLFSSRFCELLMHFNSYDLGW